MPTCATCQTANGSPCVDIKIAQKALSSAPDHGPSIEDILKFKKEITAANCGMGRVSYKRACAILAMHASMDIHGRARNLTMAQAVARLVAAKLGYRGEDVYYKLALLAQSKIDAVLGILNPKRSKYDFQKKPLLAYIYGYLVKAAPAVFKDHVSLDDDGDDEKLRKFLGPIAGLDGDTGSSETTDAAGGRRFAVSAILSAVRNAHPFLDRAIQRELKALDRLASAAADRRLTPAKMGQLERILKAVRLGLEGEMGCCLLLHPGFGNHETPSINLGTMLTSEAARRHDIYTNATVFMKGMRRSFDKFLGLLVENEGLFVLASGQLRFAADDRRQAYEILTSIAPLLELLSGRVSESRKDRKAPQPRGARTSRREMAQRDCERRASRWLGPPTADKTDKEDGGSEARYGYGIAYLPRVFGLLDPQSPLYPNLQRLLSPPDEASPGIPPQSSQ
jgi:hypothetical protein